ncbi:MAG TPA: hypothetical protein VI753_10740 [Anaerolineales bacterium]|nr:hypothetical protein [Anaerolineales bacterium]
MPQFGQKAKPCARGKPQWAHRCPLAAGATLACGAEAGWVEVWCPS